MLVSGVNIDSFGTTGTEEYRNGNVLIPVQCWMLHIPHLVHSSHPALEDHGGPVWSLHRTLTLKLWKQGYCQGGWDIGAVSSRHILAGNIN